MAAASYAHPFVPPTFLNITALWAENGVSVLQCWQILPGFTTSSQSGTIGASILQLGALSNMSYSVIPPGFNAGLHNAPTEQYVLVIPPYSLPLKPHRRRKRWVVFLSGLAHVTLPGSNVDAFIRGGANGLIFAADTMERGTKGHNTTYPSKQETRVLQIPTGGGVPNHNVLYSGPCETTKQAKRDYDALDDLD
jgi:hypothetical protein